MHFFKTGGVRYGLVYLFWRGFRAIKHKLSSLFYRSVLGECGPDTKFGSGIYVANPNQVRVGNHCHIGSQVVFTTELPDGYLTIADGVQVSDGCKIDFTGGLQIGENVLISANARIYSHDHGYDPRSIPTPLPLIIKQNVWIGADSTILPQAQSIGEGAIIGAGALVVKPVPAGAIVAGNPAKVIKFRDDHITT